MLILRLFSLFCYSVLLNAKKKSSNLTLHHMGTVLLIDMKVKIWKVTFYHWEITGWSFAGNNGNIECKACDTRYRV